MDGNVAERIRYNPQGVVKDIPPDEVGPEFYTSTDNMVFIDQRAERVQGVEQVFEPPLFPPKYLVQTENNGINYWIYASDTDIGVTDGSSHTDLTPILPITPSIVNGEWTGGKLNGLPFLNNVVDAPMYWDENLGNPFVRLPGWPVGVTVEAVRAFRFHLFGLGVTDQAGGLRDKYIWSDAADEGAVPQTWTPGPDNEAGDDLLSETRGPIVDALVLRNSFVIYKETSTYQVDYVAGNSIFSNRLLFAESGILARNCVAEVSGVHYVFTPGDLIRHDGHNIESIANEKIRTSVFEQLDPDTYITSFVVWDPTNRAVWFCFPIIGSTFPNIAAVFQVDNETWGFRRLHNETPFVAAGVINEADPETWESDNNPWDTDATLWNEVSFNKAIDRLLQTDYHNTHLFAVDVGNTNDGDLITGTLNKDSMSFGDLEKIKTISRIWPRVVGVAEPIQIRLGSQMAVTDDINWGPYKDFILGQEKLDYFMTGRYISVEFSASIQQQWGVQSFELEYNQSGAF